MIRTSLLPTRELTRGVLSNHHPKLREHLEWGDIILFRSNNSLSGLQRGFTRAEWDHVALVVRSPYASSLDLLESTAEVGCGKFAQFAHLVSPNLIRDSLVDH